MISSIFQAHTNQFCIKNDSIFLSNQVIINNHINKNIYHKIFLNFDFGSEIHLSLLVNFCHRNAINKSMNASQST